jgi:hypothetical protein
MGPRAWEMDCWRKLPHIVRKQPASELRTSTMGVLNGCTQHDELIKGCDQLMGGGAPVSSCGGVQELPATWCRLTLYSSRTPFPPGCRHLRMSLFRSRVRDYILLLIFIQIRGLSLHFSDRGWHIPAPAHRLQRTRPAVACSLSPVACRL